MKTLNRTQNLINAIEKVSDNDLLQITAAHLGNFSNNRIGTLISSLKTLKNNTRMNSVDTKLLNDKIYLLENRYYDILGASYDIFRGNCSSLKPLFRIVYETELSANQDIGEDDLGVPFKDHEIDIACKNIAAEVRERFVSDFMENLDTNQSKINYFSFFDYMLFKFWHFGTVVILVIAFILSAMICNYIDYSITLSGIALRLLAFYVLFFVVVPSFFSFINSSKLNVFTDRLRIEYAINDDSVERSGSFDVNPNISDIALKYLNATTLIDFNWLDDLLERYCTTNTQRLALKLNRIKTQNHDINYYIRTVSEFNAVK